MSQRPVIEIDNLSFAYSDRLVLEDIQLVIQPGEFIGIVGPNAGGKSTLLKLILGLLQPTRGQIRVMGVSPVESSKDLGYVPQYPSFSRDFPINVSQTVQMGCIGQSCFGNSRQQKDQVTRVLAEVDISELAERPIGALSGGQLQRVMLARALVSNPGMLILDEPTANIDQRLESEIFDLLKSLNQRMTILVVSHDIAFISSYVSRVACLNRTLVCHHTDEISTATIHELYGDHVSMVSHHH